MLFKRKHIEGIKAGKIKIAFRRWTKPSVKTGGSQQTQAGLLEIKDVRSIGLSNISSSEAKLAGFDTLAELKRELQKRDGGKVYRIELGELRVDPRIALRNAKATPDESDEILVKLLRMDKRSKKPWTKVYLNLIDRNEGLRAGDLCKEAGWEKTAFKLNVRKLKALGLTESLGVGYRLAPKGKQILTILNK